MAPSVTSSTLTISNVTATDAGVYTVEVSDGSGLSVISSGATLTVKAAQTVAFGALVAKTYGDAPFTVSATASSGLPVTFSVAAGPATVSGNTVTLTGAGTVTIRAIQAGNTSYIPAPDVDRSFTVAKATPVITWSPPTTLTVGTVLSSTQLNATATPSGGTFTYTPATGTTLSTAGTQTLSVSYAPAAADAANYTTATAQRTVTAVAFVPTVALTTETINEYLTTGGTGTFRVRITYTGQTPSGLGVAVNLPSGWTFGSYTGPSTAAQPSVGDNVLQWDFSSCPAGELTFTFTATYPSGQSGAKSLTGSVNYRPGPVDVAFAAVTVTPTTLPTITAQPVARIAAVQTGTTFSVTAAGTGTLGYQWKKDGVTLINGGNISGATMATLSLATLATGDAGSYTVVVSNTAGSVTSNAATLTVVDAQATHSVSGAGYLSGTTLTITQALTYTGPCVGLGWQMLLPAGWSYVSGGGSEGDVKPTVGDTSLLEWAWTTVPASPVTFTVTLNVPATETGDKTLSSLAVFRVSAGVANVLVKPDPLTVSQVTHHSADPDRNFRISLIELTRVIELYNTRYGTTRTGCFAVLAGSEDGFAPEPTRASTATVTLTRYHSADSDRNGKISLVELTRVIELYNTRSGTVRTGAYHVQAGTEDGFAPGP